MPTTNVARTIGGAAQFTDACKPNPGPFSVSVSGTFNATITLQKSYDGGATWHDQDPDGTWTAPTEVVVLNAGDGILWRIGCKSAEYTSGSPVVRIYQ